MPMNRLLFEHQIAKMNADASTCVIDRASMDEETARRAQDIANWRTAMGLSNTGWPNIDIPRSGGDSE